MKLIFELIKNKWWLMAVSNLNAFRMHLIEKLERDSSWIVYEAILAFTSHPSSLIPHVFSLEHWNHIHQRPAWRFPRICPQFSTHFWSFKTAIIQTTCKLRQTLSRHECWATKSWHSVKNCYTILSRSYVYRVNSNKCAKH